MFPEQEPAHGTGRQVPWERTWQIHEDIPEDAPAEEYRGQGDCVGGGGTAAGKDPVYEEGHAAQEQAEGCSVQGECGAVGIRDQQPAISRHHSDQRQGDSRTPGRKAKKPNEVVPELLEYENRS